jgi:hypothetical protein
MKPVKLILLALILVVAGCRAPQPKLSKPITGFLNLKWGESPDSVRAKLATIPGIIFKSDTSGLRFSNGQFYNQEVTSWVLDFWKGKQFYMVHLYFKLDSVQAEQFYAELNTEFQKQFGEPTDVRNNQGARQQFWLEHIAGTNLSNTLSTIVVFRPDIPYNIEVFCDGLGTMESQDKAQTTK